MAENPFVQKKVSIDRKAVVAANPGVAGAARWFWWIAGLSFVNSVLIHSGSQTSFVIGLGFTLIADVVFQHYKIIAFIIDIFAIGFFVLIGFYALRGYLWAFAVGAVVYLLDALIYLYFEDFMPLAFHALALFFIVNGARSLRSALQVARAAAETPIQTSEPPLVPVPPPGGSPLP